MADKKKTELTPKELTEKVTSQEKAIEQLKAQLGELGKRFRIVLTKKYPHIIPGPVSGGAPHPTNQNLTCTIGTNVPADNVYEVAITNEDGTDVDPPRVLPVTFMDNPDPKHPNTKISPSNVVTFTPDMLRGLGSTTAEYLLVCRPAGNGTDPNFVVAKVAMRFSGAH